MTGIAEGALILAGMALALPVLVMLGLVLVALPPRRTARVLQADRPRIAILVPAHNEEFTIGNTLASIGRQLSPGDRLAVIADNCSDATAAAARLAGAEVTVRTDPQQRGKGFALDHGLKFLERTGAPEVVIFVDADCQLNSGCIDRLTLSAVQSMAAVQAAYLMNTPQPARKTASTVAFAWTVKDFVRPLGWHRLGLPCPLAGSGMAFPWDVVQSIDFAGAHLAEDLKYGLDLALLGKFVRFCPDAVVRSDVAVGGKPSGSQRARWEHGVMETTLAYFPRLMFRFCRAPSLHLLAVMLDLCVPPLALLALALGAELALALVLLRIAGAAAPVIISTLECGLFLAAILLAWWRHGQEIIPLRWLVFAPLYAARKIPMYGRFLLNRQRIWTVGDRQPVRPQPAAGPAARP